MKFRCLKREREILKFRCLEREREIGGDGLRESVKDLGFGLDGERER